MQARRRRGRESRERCRVRARCEGGLRRETAGEATVYVRGVGWAGVADPLRPAWRDAVLCVVSFPLSFSLSSAPCSIFLTSSSRHVAQTGHTHRVQSTSRCRGNRPGAERNGAQRNGAAGSGGVPLIASSTISSALYLHASSALYSRQAPAGASGRVKTRFTAGALALSPCCVHIAFAFFTRTSCSYACTWHIPRYS